MSDRHPYMFSCGLDKMVKGWDLEQNKVNMMFGGCGLIWGVVGWKMVKGWDLEHIPSFLFLVGWGSLGGWVMYMGWLPLPASLVGQCSAQRPAVCCSLPSVGHSLPLRLGVGLCSWPETVY